VDPVPVVLEVEIELAVRILECVRIDASAKVGLADDRLRVAVDEGAERARRDANADALGVLL